MRGLGRGRVEVVRRKGKSEGVSEGFGERKGERIEVEWSAIGTMWEMERREAKRQVGRGAVGSLGWLCICMELRGVYTSHSLS